MDSVSSRLHTPRMVDFYDFRLFPVTRALGPAQGIKQNSLLVQQAAAADRTLAGLDTMTDLALNH